MYSKTRNIIIGFHGCDKDIRDKIVLGEEEMQPSLNNFDWLGHGFYFWENNEERALQFAQEQQKRQLGTINEPAVLGAFIDLGDCLDLIDSKYLNILKEWYPHTKRLF